jgi:hypothetical protein
MSESGNKTIPIPREGFFGIQALIELGVDNLSKLAKTQSKQPLELNLSTVYDQLVRTLGCDRRTIRTAFLNALVPLNGLRRSLEMEPSEFLAALDHTVTERADDEWKQQHLKSWKKLVPRLSAFFQPDNFFAHVSKAFDLLLERPSVLQNVRVLTELRPIYDEALSESVAILQTNTLVLDYFDGSHQASLYLAMDNSDLESLQSELERARKKIQVSRREATEKNIHLVTVGESQS